MATSEHRTPPPPDVWRGLGLAAVLLLVGAIAAIGLISAGVFDPQPTGEVTSRRTLSAQKIGAGKTRLTWLSEAETGDTYTYTVRLTATWAEGEQDVGYGVAVGTEEDYLIAAVSPLGYAAVWVERGGQRETAFPWQPWPHVHRGAEANEVQVKVTGDHVSVRVNHELLWEGERAVQGTAAGLFAQSFAEETIIDFRELVTFAPARALIPAPDSP